MGNKSVIGVIVVLVVLIAVAVGTCGACNRSDNERPKTAQISGLQTFMRNESYGVGEGWLSGAISNPTDEVRDYEITIQRYAPRGGAGSGTETMFMETVGRFSVLQVRPGEQRAWEYQLFERRGFKNLNWEWRVCVDGWCWIRLGR